MFINFLLQEGLNEEFYKEDYLKKVEQINK